VRAPAGDPAPCRVVFSMLEYRSIPAQRTAKRR